MVGQRTAFVIGAVALVAATATIAVHMWRSQPRSVEVPVTTYVFEAPDPAPPPPVSSRIPLAERGHQELAVAPAVRQRKELPAWLRFAAAQPEDRDRPMIAVVIDDLGLSVRDTRRAIAMPGPLTLAFLPYATELPVLAAEARAAGHELMVHMPMEPDNGGLDPGPNALLSREGRDSLRRKLVANLDRFHGYVGVNNHMGSRFTADRSAMRDVMEVLHEHGLLFLDSRTTKETVAMQVATDVGVPRAERDVFLDNDPRPSAIRVQTDLVEVTARAQGFAITIGHPHDTTLAVLEEWLPGLAERGFVLVPVSALVIP